MIAWDTKHYSNQIDDLRFNFLVSQGILGYKFVPRWLDKVTLVYAAMLVNSAADRLKITNYEKQNLGGYVGISIGQLKKQHDWAFDANYQVLQAQVIPNFDNNGIGIGNAGRSSKIQSHTQISFDLLPNHKHEYPSESAIDLKLALGSKKTVPYISGFFKE